MDVNSAPSFVPIPSSLLEETIVGLDWSDWQKVERFHRPETGAVVHVYFQDSSRRVLERIAVAFPSYVMIGDDRVSWRDVLMYRERVEASLVLAARVRFVESLKRVA